jgi:hypothetical protein
MSAEDWKPNLFVPGFAKAGSTAICDYLSQHPSIYVIKGKEPRTLSKGEKLPSWWTWVPYFSDKECMNLDRYRELYVKHKDYAYRVDGSISYTFTSDYPKRLSEFSKDAKIIIMIRNQKKRMISVYYYNYASHREANFSKWIKSFLLPDFDNFLYFQKIVSYYESFGKNCLVIDNNLLKVNPQRVMDNVCDFLKLQKIAITQVASNIGRLAHLGSESDRKSFARLYPLASAASYLARLILDNTGKYGKTLKTKLIRFGPTMLVEKLSNTFAETKNNEHGYSDLINAIPDAVSQRLDEDYKMTLDFCRDKGILIADGDA